MARPNRARTIEAERNLARRIKLEREDRSWSPAQLAQRMTEAGCSISTSAIYKIEDDEKPRKITVDELVALAAVLRTTPGALLGGEADEFTRGFLEGVDVAARIFRNHIGVRQPATDPMMPATGPTLAQDGLSGPGGTSGRGEGYEALQWPTSLWGQGFYRSTEETD